MRRFGAPLGGRVTRPCGGLSPDRSTASTIAASGPAGRARLFACSRCWAIFLRTSLADRPSGTQMLRFLLMTIRRAESANGDPAPRPHLGESCRRHSRVASAKRDDSFVAIPLRTRSRPCARVSVLMSDGRSGIPAEPERITRSASAERRVPRPKRRPAWVEVGMTAGQIILFGRFRVAGAHASLWVSQIPGVGDSARRG